MHLLHTYDSLFYKKKEDSKLSFLRLNVLHFTVTTST